MVLIVPAARLRRFFDKTPEAGKRSTPRAGTYTAASLRVAAERTAAEKSTSWSRTIDRHVNFLKVYAEMLL